MLKILSLATFALCISALSADVAKANDVADVRACFSAYKKAMTELNGEAAAAVVDADTINYYSQLLKHARQSKAEVVRGLDPFDMLLVLLVRHNLTPEKLKEMNGRSLFIFAINDEWTDSKSMAQVDVENIRVEGDQATANIQGAEISFSFAKEKGKWKIDITSFVAIVNKALSQAIKNSGQSNAVVVKQMLMQSTEEPIADDIWDPKG